MNISLKQLNVFVTVAKLKTVTAAADILCLSKAAVSLSLSELESQIKHALFDRVNNRLVLNQEGLKLLPLADELLKRASDISTIYSAEQSLTGPLCLGASDTIGNQIAPFLLSQFRQAYQHKSQQLLIDNTGVICQKLMSFEIDIGLTEGTTELSVLNKIPWVKDEMCIICPQKHAFSSEKETSLKHLAHSDWLLRESGSGSREFFLKKLAPKIESWQQVFQLNSTEAIINAVSAGIGFACISRLSAAQAIKEKRVGEVVIDMTMERQFWLLIHKDKYQSPLVKAFLEFCVQFNPAKCF